MPARGTAVLFVFFAGQALFGLVAAAALFAARRRASKRAVMQVAVIIVVVESFILAAAGAAINSALRGNPALTSALVLYAGAGWIAVQFIILGWWFWAWRQSKR
jgi:hypothetical protein